MTNIRSFITEAAETIARLKKNEEAKRTARQHGLERVGKDVMDGKTRYRYSDKGVDKGDTSYHSHMQYKRGHQDQRHGDVQTTITKVKQVKNGIERSTVDRKKHDSVKSAVAHLDSIRNYHKKAK